MKTEKEIKVMIYKLNSDILYCTNLLVETIHLTKSNMDALNKLITIYKSNIYFLEWVLR